MVDLGLIQLNETVTCAECDADIEKHTPLYTIDPKADKALDFHPNCFAMFVRRCRQALGDIE